MKKNNLFFKTSTIIGLLFIATGCATILSKSNWPIKINSTPAGASVIISSTTDSAVFKGVTPATVKLKSGAGYFKKQSYKIKLLMVGYADKIIPLTCSLNGWYIGNIFLGGIIGFLIVDPATGAMFKLDNTNINETLVKLPTAINEPKLEIMNIADVPATWKEHLVAIK